MNDSGRKEAIQRAAFQRLFGPAYKSSAESSGERRWAPSEINRAELEIVSGGGWPEHGEELAPASELGTMSSLLHELLDAVENLERFERDGDKDGSPHEPFDALYATASRIREEAQLPQCEHDWIDIRNSVVESGEMCKKCHRIRPGGGRAGAGE